MRRCDGAYGKIINGCGEDVDVCSSRGSSCVANTQTQSCECLDKINIDQCSNLPGIQLSVPM